MLTRSLPQRVIGVGGCLRQAGLDRPFLGLTPRQGIPPIGINDRGLGYRQPPLQRGLTFFSVLTRAQEGSSRSEAYDDRLSTCI